HPDPRRLDPLQDLVAVPGDGVVAAYQRAVEVGGDQLRQSPPGHRRTSSRDGPVTVPRPDGRGRRLRGRVQAARAARGRRAAATYSAASSIIPAPSRRDGRAPIPASSAPVAATATTRAPALHSAEAAVPRPRTGPGVCCWRSVATAMNAPVTAASTRALATSAHQNRGATASVTRSTALSA